MPLELEINLGVLNRNRFLIFEQMDRTAILADAIDYMKELLEKIGNLQREMDRTNQTTRNSFHDTKPSEFVVRNSPKVTSLFFCLWFSNKHSIHYCYCETDLENRWRTVWGGKQKRKHEDRDLLCGEARITAIDGEYDRSIGAWDSTLCNQLLQWLRIASHLFSGNCFFIPFPPILC